MSSMNDCFVTIEPIIGETIPDGAQYKGGNEWLLPDNDEFSSDDCDFEWRGPAPAESSQTEQEAT